MTTTTGAAAVRWGAAGLVLATLLAGCGSTAQGSGSTDPSTYATALTASTNSARQAEGLDPLTSSDCAAGAAGDRSAVLAGGADLTHAPLAGVIDTCSPATTAAENLSRASAPAQDVVDAWMESPGHRANIVDPALTELGVACVDDGDAMLCSAVFLGP